MNEQAIFQGIIYVWFPLSAFVLLYLMFVPAPYGRHARKGWGPHAREKLGWVIMESPAVLVFGFLFVIGDHYASPVAIIFFVMWEFHYVYRAYIFSALMREGRRLPWAIVGMGFFFNTINAYINARYLFTLCEPYPTAWLADPRFLIGACLFAAGFAIHFTSDRILRGLRKPGETGHKIPYGGMFRWISTPNYFGEMVEWLGWAVATWSAPGLAFFVWTFANVFPRTLMHHKWYLRTFPDYPEDRKAVIPRIL